jgi:hypothetical protein
MDEIIKWIIDDYKVAPVCATIIIVVWLVLKYRPWIDFTHYVKREDCHAHIDSVTTELKEIKENIRLIFEHMIR